VGNKKSNFDANRDRVLEAVDSKDFLDLDALQRGENSDFFCLKITADQQ